MSVARPGGWHCPLFDRGQLRFLKRTEAPLPVPNVMFISCVPPLHILKILTVMRTDGTFAGEATEQGVRRRTQPLAYVAIAAAAFAVTALVLVAVQPKQTYALSSIDRQDGKI